MSIKPDDALKSVWAYMIERGVLTSGVWSVYGGFEASTKACDKWSKEYSKQKENFLAKVKNVGVDWGKTKEPKSSQENEFNGTFVPHSVSETLLGTLYLKDGSKYLIGVGDVDERFKDYLSSIIAFMEDHKRVKEILGEDIG